MEFIQPGLLWGALAVVIPIAIHFWHQKKGQLLPWAATQWLIEKEQQQHRGLRLENLLLLVVRCLLLMLLAFLLSQPILNGLNASNTVQRIHLVQPDQFLVNNFRFELEDALKKGEPVYWVGQETTSMSALTSLPTPSNVNPLILQTAINRVRTNEAELHLYVLNQQQWAEVPAIYVPSRFRLHAVADSARRPVQAYLDGGTKKLFVNAANQLTSSAALPTEGRFRPTPVRTGGLVVLVDYRNPVERQTVVAALKALADVYGLDLAVELARSAAKPYDWVLTDQLPARLSSKALYVVSGVQREPVLPNVVYTTESLTPQTSERVAAGQLPEWLGEQFVRHFGLHSVQVPLSRQQLAGLFVPSARKNTKHQERVQQLLTALLVVLIGVERWIALRKNA